jgi:hypothetical protein
VSADVVEENLSKAFTRAESWNAIVLMDEADVFLIRRSPHNLERGALVSSKLSSFSLMSMPVRHTLNLETNR